MKISDSVSMAFLDIKRRKTRTILTVFALSVGTLLLLLMLGAGDTLRNQVKDLFNSMGDTTIVQVSPSKYDVSNVDVEVVMNTSETNQKKQMVAIMEQSEKNQKENFKKIDEKTVKDFYEIDGVKTLIAQLNGKITAVEIEGETVKNKEVNIEGDNLKYNTYKEDDIEYGSKLSNSNDVIVGEKYLKSIGVDKREELIGKKIKLIQEFPVVNGVATKEAKIIEGTVVGIQKDYNSIITSDTVVNEFLTYINDGKNYLDEHGYDVVGITGNEAKDVLNITKVIREEFNYNAMNMQEITAMLDSMMMVVKAIFAIAGIIVLVVGAFGLVNTMSMTIQERKQNIGVMKAVGAPRSSIRWIYIIESAVISIGAAILGTILSIIAVVIINNVADIAVPISGTNIIGAILFSVLVGVIAGLLPAGRAAKMNVVEILSYE